MKKICFLLVLNTIFVLDSTKELLACTTFCLKGVNQIVLCKNLDWDYDYGIVEVNIRGLIKKAFVANNEMCFEWTAKYGSVTFNHIGKEFPLGGMNEAGLVVEEMNYYWTKYPPPDNRPTLNELQWIQFQLDNFSTVEEVIGSDSLLRITKSFFNIHYIICDKKGNVATIEFIDGKMVYHTKSTLGMPVLTNHRYDESMEALKDYQGFGGSRDIPQEYESLNNFIRASSMIQKYSSNIPIIDYSFQILSVVSTDDTQWSIVYDISNSCIYFETKKHKLVKKINLKAFNLSCYSTPLSLDINTELVGDVSAKFTFYDSIMNQQLVYKIYDEFKSNGVIKKNIGYEYFKAIANYPSSIKCSK